jgi:hypothetical protein
MVGGASCPVSPPSAAAAAAHSTPHARTHTPTHPTPTQIKTGNQGVIISNDGATILKHMSVLHPAAKMLVDLSAAQDIEAGDGTTSVVVLAGAFLGAAQDLLRKGIHPTTIAECFQGCSAKATEYLGQMSKKLELTDRESLLKSATTSLNSKVRACVRVLVCSCFAPSSPRATAMLGSLHARTTHRTLPTHTPTHSRTDRVPVLWPPGPHRRGLGAAGDRVPHRHQRGPQGHPAGEEAGRHHRRLPAH